MPMAEQMKSAVGFSASGQNRNTIAIGTNRRSQVSDGFSSTMNTGCIADTKFGLGAPSAGVLFKVALASSLRFGPFDTAARIQNTNLARTEHARLRY
jgi:hypothetical protein